MTILDVGLQETLTVKGGPSEDSVIEVRCHKETTAVVGLPEAFDLQKLSAVPIRRHTVVEVGLPEALTVELRPPEDSVVEIRLHKD